MQLELAALDSPADVTDDLGPAQPLDHASLTGRPALAGPPNEREHGAEQSERDADPLL